MRIFRVRLSPTVSGGSHCAFSLLELLAVMALLALVAGLATVRFSSSYRQAQVTTAIHSIQAIDDQLRTLATKQAQPYELRIDLDRNTLEIKGQHKKEVIRKHVLPAALQIEAVRSPREDRHHGEAVIRCDSAGLCETYALQITAPSSPPRWILFAGVTGQSNEQLTDRQIEELFNALRPQRSHPD